MSRAQRLLDLIQLLRRRRHPISGATLARELDVSLRTLYRDIATLSAQGACIEGEAGVGYVLRPGFLLPPMMFSEDEIEALVLGSRWVAERADEPLGDAARNALAKIVSVLPEDMRDAVDGTGLLVAPGTPRPAGDALLAAIRQAMRREQKLRMSYVDRDGEPTRRVVWPIALGFFDRARIVVAWCELRDDYRSFRTDRITALMPLETRYPRRRRALLKEWRGREGIPPPRD
jgi:predicted DNA-binding transcriptional regulator YafY